MSHGLNFFDGGELPHGWIDLDLGHIRRTRSITFNPDKEPAGTYELYSVPSHATGMPEVIKASEIGSNKQYVEPGDVLISKINPRINRAWVVGDFSHHKKIASTEWIVFSKSALIQSKLLQYMLTDGRVRDYLSHNASGVGGSLTRVKPGLMDTISIGLPPENEQRRVVEKIEELFSELDKGIESLKNARQQLKVYRQAVLKHAFEGKLTAKWREENKDELDLLVSASPKDHRREIQRPDSYSIPDSWRWSGVEGLLLEGPSNGRSVKDRVDGFPVLRLTALKDGRIDLAEYKRGDWSRESALQFIVQPGEFLLSRGNGSKHLVGRGGVVPVHQDEIAFPDTMVRLRVDPQTMHIGFFSLLWESRLVRRQIESAARTTAGIYKINQGHIKGFQVPVPDLDEQEVITGLLEEKLSVVEELERDLVIRMTASETLRQSILKKAFSGQLVPQDPSDEPASVLLERIRSEKVKQSKPGRKKKRKTAA